MWETEVSGAASEHACSHRQPRSPRVDAELEIMEGRAVDW